MAVPLWMVFIGLGLTAGGIYILSKPRKSNPDKPNEKLPPDYKTAAILLVIGLFLLYRGYKQIRFGIENFTPMGRIGQLRRMGRMR